MTGQKRAIESSKKRPGKMGEREDGWDIGRGKEGSRRSGGDLVRGREGEAAGRSGGLRDQESLPPSFWIAKMRQCGEGALSFAVCSNSITRPMHIHRLTS